MCEYHVKAQVVLVDEVRQRFCQQCSRFGELGSTFMFSNFFSLCVFMCFSRFMSFLLLLTLVVL